jgi:hypothetical protein
VFVFPSFAPPFKTDAPLKTGEMLATHASVPEMPHDRARFGLNATLTNVLALPSSAPSATPTAFDVAPFDSVAHVPLSALPHDRATSASAYPRPLKPATLEHTVVAAPTASVFAGQPMHALLPTTCLYLPGTHATQLVISPVYPTLHTQAVLPTPDSELLGHDTHVLLAVACTAVEYVLTGQIEHAAL